MFSLLLFHAKGNNLARIKFQVVSSPHNFSDHALQNFSNSSHAKKKIVKISFFPKLNICSLKDLIFCWPLLKWKSLALMFKRHIRPISLKIKHLNYMAILRNFFPAIKAKMEPSTSLESVMIWDKWFIKFSYRYHESLLRFGTYGSDKKVKLFFLFPLISAYW